MVRGQEFRVDAATVSLKKLVMACVVGIYVELW
jgi:hypothetical protein